MKKRSYALVTSLSATALAAFLSVNAYDGHLQRTVQQEQARTTAEVQQAWIAANCRKALKVTEAKAASVEQTLPEEYKAQVRSAAQQLTSQQGYSFLRTAEEWCPPCKMLKKAMDADKSISIDAVISNNTLEESLFTKRTLAQHGIYLGPDIPALAIRTSTGIQVYKGYTADGKVEDTLTGQQVYLRDVLSGKR